MRLILRVMAAVALLAGLATVAFPQVGRPKGGQIKPPVPGLPQPGMKLPAVPRTPAQVQAELRPYLATKPTEVFTRLGGHDGQIVGETAKLGLAREAAEKVALKVESAEPVEAVSLARAAKAMARNMPADVRATLDRVAQEAERRFLAEGLEAARSRAAGGQWADAARTAKRWLEASNDSRLANNRHLETPEFAARLAEARAALESTRALAERFDAVARFGKTLGDVEGLKPRVVAGELSKIDGASLPAKLAQHLDGLRGVAEVQEMMSSKWASAPEVKKVKASVARLERGLTDLADADASLGKKLLQELAVKALLEGHADAALKLLPTAAPADHAARLLADLRALTLGEGNVETTPGKTAAEAGKPPGLAPLARDGKSPPIGKSKDEPPLLKATALSAAITTQAGKAVAAERLSLEGRAAETIVALTKLQDRILAPDLPMRKQLAAVEAELDRRLTPAERVRVRALLGPNTSPKQIAGGMKAPLPEDEEEKAFVADVERRLDQPLQTVQRAQAARLRKQGRTAAEVADILRR